MILGTGTLGTFEATSSSGVVSSELVLKWDSYTLIEASVALLWDLNSTVIRFSQIDVDVLSCSLSPAANLGALSVDVISLPPASPAALGAIYVELLSVMSYGPPGALGSIYIDVLNLSDDSNAVMSAMHVSILSANDDITPRPKVFVAS